MEKLLHISETHAQKIVICTEIIKITDKCRAHGFHAKGSSLTVYRQTKVDPAMSHMQLTDCCRRR